VLLAAGVARAAARLADEPEYDGETWQLASEEIIGRGAGVVTIQAALAENAESWLVTIVAEYPAGSEISIRRTRSLTIQP
jgi:hypothetical protein